MAKKAMDLARSDAEIHAVKDLNPRKPYFYLLRHIIHFSSPFTGSVR